MTIGTDFEIQNDRDIRYVGAAHGVAGAGYYSVLAFHEWLRDLADDAQAGTDYMDITRPTPSEKAYETIVTLINNYNIDQTASEHLYQGSIIQAEGDEVWDGIQVIANEGCDVQIVQNGAILTNDFWNSIPDGETEKGLNRDVANGIAMRFMLQVRTAAADIDGRRLICQTRVWGKTFSEFKLNGTGRGVNVVPLTYVTDLNNATVEGTAATWTGVALANAGYTPLDVDNDTTNEYYYCEWNRAAYTINQFYERMKYLTRQGTAETTFGLNGELFRGITHEITVDGPTGTWDEDYEQVTWTGGSGQLLAINHQTTPTKMWIQLLTGVAPTDGQVIAGGTSGGTADVNVTVAEKSVSTPYCGQSTGSALIGSYGFCLEVLDLSSSDKITALNGEVYSAPNYVTFTLANLATSDYVVVGPHGYRFAYDNEATGPFTVGETLTFTSPAGTAVLTALFDMGTEGMMYIGPMLTGTVPQDNSTISGTTATADVNGAVSNDVNLRQMTLNGALTGGTVTSVVVNESIPTDTPATGTIRIERISGKRTKHSYSAWNSGTKTFTITSHDFSGDNAPDDGGVFVSYIDTVPTDDDEAFTSIYSAARTLFIRVRNGGPTTAIKTFESTGTLGAAGGSATAVRTSDL